jgi:hypothetical protein
MPACLRGWVKVGAIAAGAGATASGAGLYATHRFRSGGVPFAGEAGQGEHRSSWPQRARPPRARRSER